MRLENPGHGDWSSRLIDDDCGRGFSEDVSYEIVHFLRETAMNRLVCEITNIKKNIYFISALSNPSLSVSLLSPTTRMVATYL